MAIPVAYPPTNTPLLIEDKGKITNALTAPWIQWMISAWTNLRSPAGTTVPANSTVAGVPGQLAYDQNFLYVCVGVNLWKRIALTNF